MALRRPASPEGQPFKVMGVCSDCHMEQEVIVHAVSPLDIEDPMACPKCEGEFYKGAVECLPNELRGADLSGGFR